MSDIFTRIAQQLDALSAHARSTDLWIATSEDRFASQTHYNRILSDELAIQDARIRQLENQVHGPWHGHPSWSALGTAMRPY